MSIRDLERQRAGTQDGMEEGQGVVSHQCVNRASDQRRTSVLPLRWRLLHSARWRGQVLASEISLIAFILLLVMVLSKQWLYLSKCQLYQRWPPNVTNSIYRTAHIMSMGILQMCKSNNCSQEELENDTFKMWTSHPAFGLSRITFYMALGLGFILTVWLHLPYLPGCQRMPLFIWIGTILSFCEVAFIFTTLILFPVNVWIFEVNKNLSIPIGWGYFIGWLVFILYMTCGLLSYLNYKHFWRLVISPPVSRISSEKSKSEDIPRSRKVSSISTAQSEKVLEKKKESLDPEAMKVCPDPEAMKASPDPEAMKASPDPEAMKASPDPEATKASPDPEPMKASPDPVPMKASLGPEQSKASLSPVQMKASLNPQQMKASLDSQQMKAFPDPEESKASPSPEQMKAPLDSEQSVTSTK